MSETAQPVPWSVLIMALLSVANSQSKMNCMPTVPDLPGQSRILALRVHDQQFLGSPKGQLVQ